MGKIAERFRVRQLRIRDESKGMTLAQALTEGKQKVKGLYDGLCNRTACQTPRGVHYYNKYSYAFYCADCAHLLNETNARFKDADDGAPFVHLKTAEEALNCYVMK